MGADKQPWVAPRLIILTSSADAKAKATAGFSVDSFYLSGYPKGYS